MRRHRSISSEFDRPVSAAPFLVTIPWSWAIFLFFIGVLLLCCPASMWGY